MIPHILQPIRTSNSLICLCVCTNLLAWLFKLRRVRSACQVLIIIFITGSITLGWIILTIEVLPVLLRKLQTHRSFSLSLISVEWVWKYHVVWLCFFVSFVVIYFLVPLYRFPLRWAIIRSHGPLLSNWGKFQMKYLCASSYSRWLLLFIIVPTLPTSL